MEFVSHQYHPGGIDFITSNQEVYRRFTWDSKWCFNNNLISDIELINKLLLAERAYMLACIAKL